MAFYANIDAAVEDAVFGGRRNSLRNTPAETGTQEGGEKAAEGGRTGEGIER